jgi:hypothetical protein
MEMLIAGTWVLHCKKYVNYVWDAADTPNIDVMQQGGDDGWM